MSHETDPRLLPIRERYLRALEREGADGLTLLLATWDGRPVEDVWCEGGPGFLRLLAFLEEQESKPREPSPDEAYQEATEALERLAGSRVARAILRAIQARLAMLGIRT